MAVADLALSHPARSARLTERDAVRWARGYFVVLSAIGVCAFILGVENRFTTDSLFYLAPQVNFLPPLSSQAWSAGFAAHQQNPAYAACVGTESLSEFKLFYWWEWLRRASVLALAAVGAVGLITGMLASSFRFALPRLAGLCALIGGFWLARFIVQLTVADIDVISQFDVGQYDTAIDVIFASAALAVVLASAVTPPLPFAVTRGNRSGMWLWIVFIALDIGFGAMVAAKDAAVVWPTWPDYQGHALPPVAELLSYSPLWLNLTVNPYMLQLVHRTLSGGLWLAALCLMVATRRNPRRLKGAAIIFSLLTLEMVTGILTLIQGVPPALSIAHQIGGAVLLAGMIVAFDAGSPGKAGIAPAV